MDLLQRLRPRWRHPDPEIRAAAVRELGAEHQDRLGEIARDDVDPHVRRIAIKKLDSPDLLLTIATDDVEPALRDLATARARDLLVGIACSSAPAAEGEAALSRVTDEPSLAAVAVGGAHASVRRAALARVSSDRLLRDVVRNASDLAVRHEALDRLADPAALRSIAVSDCPVELALRALVRIDDPEALRAIAENHAASKDVRRRARELVAEKAGEGTTVAFKDGRARQHALCLAAEALSAERDAVLAATRARELNQEWQELARQVPPREDTAVRFATACEVVLEGAASVERRRAEVENAETARQERLAMRRALCERVEGLEGTDTPRLLAEVRAAWGRLPAVSDEDALPLAHRFKLACEACEARHQRWLAEEGHRAELVAAVEEAEALAAATPVPPPKRWRALERRWASLGGPEDDELHRRLTSAKEQLERRRQEGEQQDAELRRQNLTRLESLSGRLQELAKAEATNLRAVRRELATVEAALGDLGPLPPSESRQAWTERLAAARDELVARLRREEETEEWRRWANAGAQEEIIQRVEGLLAANDLTEGARQLPRLQDEWAAVASATPDKSQALWDRFRTARNELRRRCDAYLAENLEKKRALCAQVAEVGDSTAWNETAELIRRVQAEWKEIGPVPGRHARTLWKQFREPCDRFFARRSEHWERVDAERREHAKQKIALCEQAEALADSTDWENTAAAMKRLQAEWKRTGPLPRAEGEALWQRFRGACDRFFERRGRREEIAREETLNRARALCDELESVAASLAAAEADAASEEPVGRKVDESWAEWRRLDLGTGAEVSALSERLVQAYRQIVELRPASLTGTRLDPAATRKRREKLCLRLEELAASLTAAPRQMSLQEMALALRERLATNTIAGGSGSASPGRQRVEDEAARIVASWAQIGPALDAEGRAFEERFERAAAAVRRA
jgi:hypothetical protein